jgi:hypothetical protein
MKGVHTLQMEMKARIIDISMLKVTTLPHFLLTKFFLHIKKREMKQRVNTNARNIVSAVNYQ